MKSFKSKKSKVIIACLAVILIASILCVTLVGCNKPVIGETPLGVYFVGDFQRAVADEDLAAITAEGAEIISISKALEQAGIDAKNDPAKAAAAIYATAVTNYNNVTQTGYYILTNALVTARNALAGNDVQVGIRSTYSSFSGKNGSFGQTVSGVTQLDGLGALGDELKSKFGYNIQNFSNANFSAFRRGSNGGAQFPSESDDANVYKYILGGYNTSLTERVEGKDDKLKITPASNAEESKPLPEYEPEAGATYPKGTTLAGKPLPSFNKNRKAWEPLNRLPVRSWVDNKVVENGTEVAGTRYSYGNYGAGFAVYDFSRPEYLSNNTKITYDETLKLWKVEVAILDEYVDQACEFAAGDLIRDTKDYIKLKNAKFTKISCVFEVYENGLIKSMQKRDVLNTNEKCEMIVGTCQDGGTTSNTATMAFSYSDYDTDANRLAALYWPELGDSKMFSKKKVSTTLKLDLSSYDTMSTYAPVVNEELMASFNDIFATKK